MSWDKTYSHTLLIALDQFAAAVIFNRPDLTISAMCWMVSSGHAESLKLYGWQRAFLAGLAPVLDRIQAQHCLKAAFGDWDRSISTLSSLRLGQIVRPK